MNKPAGGRIDYRLQGLERSGISPHLLAGIARVAQVTTEILSCEVKRRPDGGGAPPRTP